jgi:hypothetical protein
MSSRCVCFGAVRLSVGQKSSIAWGCAKGRPRFSAVLIRVLVLALEGLWDQGSLETAIFCQFGLDTLTVFLSVFVYLLLSFLIHSPPFSFLSLFISFSLCVFLLTTASERELENKGKTVMSVNGLIYIDCSDVGDD